MRPIVASGKTAADFASKDDDALTGRRSKAYDIFGVTFRCRIVTGCLVDLTRRAFQRCTDSSVSVFVLR